MYCFAGGVDYYVGKENLERIKTRESIISCLGSIAEQEEDE
jgi:hypothetical protein